MQVRSTVADSSVSDKTENEQSYRHFLYGVKDNMRFTVSKPDE